MRRASSWCQQWLLRLVLLGSSLFLGLQVVAATSMGLQRAVLRLAQPWVLTGLTLVFYFVAKNRVGLASGSAVLGVAMVYMMYRYWVSRRARQSRKLTAITPAPSSSQMVSNDGSRQMSLVSTESDGCKAVPMDTPRTSHVDIVDHYKSDMDVTLLPVDHCIGGEENTRSAPLEIGAEGAECFTRRRESVTFKELMARFKEEMNIEPLSGVLDNDSYASMSWENSSSEDKLSLGAEISYDEDVEQDE